MAKLYEVEVPLSASLTAYMMHNLVGNSYQSRKNQQINEKFAEMRNTIKSKISKSQQNITENVLQLKLEKLFQIKGKPITSVLPLPRNIYNNLCKYHELKEKLDAIFSLKDNQLQFIDLSNGIGLQIYETHLTKCCSCDSKLIRITRNNGTICVSYCELEGPIVGISYKKKCSNTNCGMIYTYGETITNDKIIKNQLYDLEYFELTQHTYFKKSIFNIIKQFVLSGSGGIEKYVELYNFKHQEAIKSISQHLEHMHQNLGKRITAQLCTNRMSEAFYLATLQQELENQLQLTIEIPKTIKNKIIEKKISRINIHRSSQNSETLSQNSDTSSKTNDPKLTFTPDDMFNFLYEKYEDDINNIDSEILSKVPVDSENNVYPGHFVCVIDGNAKNVRKICAYPEDLRLRGMFFIYLLNLDKICKKFW